MGEIRRGDLRAVRAGRDVLAETLFASLDQRDVAFRGGLCAFMTSSS